MQEDFIEFEPRQIPVYLFTGFLEGGKTKFIQETLEDERFNTGESALLLMCEDGEEEYSPDTFAAENVFIREIDSVEDLSTENLAELLLETNAERVMVEYNGMWMLDELYMNMPEGWMVYQEFMFADSATFLSYNANMRQLMYDKLKSCDLLVLNRFPEGEDIMPYHKIVRAANRSCDIAYEGLDGVPQYDEIIDPLPFDKEADIIDIADGDYAIWYRDLNEALVSYQDKKVRFKAQVATTDELEEGTVIVGRRMMTCCADDISFAGLVAIGCSRGIADGDWVELTASIAIDEHPGYDRPGPVLTVIEMAPAGAPEEEVATFM